MTTKTQDSELCLFTHRNLNQRFLNQIKILPVVERCISAGGFLQNVNISIKEDVRNTFITVFWLFFLSFQLGSERENTNNAVATENLLYLKVFIVEGLDLRGIKVLSNPNYSIKKAQCALVNSPSSLHILEKAQNSLHGPKPRPKLLSFS